MVAKIGKVTRIKFEKKGTDNLTLRVIGVSGSGQMLLGKKAPPDPAIIDKNERAYFNDLHKIVDQIFMEACDLEWTWSHLAEQAGICYTTVDNLGMRRTKRPQYRTVYMLAVAVGFQISIEEKPRKKARVKVA